MVVVARQRRHMAPAIQRRRARGYSRQSRPDMRPSSGWNPPPPPLPLKPSRTQHKRPFARLTCGVSIIRRHRRQVFQGHSAWTALLTTADVGARVQRGAAFKRKLLITVGRGGRRMQRGPLAFMLWLWASVMGVRLTQWGELDV
jgi:hypothetical protein